MTAYSDTTADPAVIFGRLFENEFATLDGIAISCRRGDGMDYADGTVALSRWLEGSTTSLSATPTAPAEPAGRSAPATPAAPADMSAHALHAALYAASPAYEAVISGWSRHLRALLLEGLGVPPATSMMRNRGVPDMTPHLVEPDALELPQLEAAIARARALADENGMRHLLMLTTGGMVVVAGAPPFEAMAHWHNIELAARVECLRLEEVATYSREA